MMDLWATVPYYTAYLSRGLLRRGVNLTVGSITYYLDTGCFTSRGIRVDPGPLDFVGQFQLPRLLRRVLKLLESLLNMSALTVRFMFNPPDVIHVQYLPMLKWRLPIDFWFLRYCRRRRATVVLTVHDLMPHDTAERHKQTFYRLYAMVDGLICHSDHIKKRLHTEFAVHNQKIAVIPHGPFFYDLPSNRDEAIIRTVFPHPGKVMVLWQGIIFPYKGIDLLLNAWRMVDAATNEAYLVIVGTGGAELLDEIRSQIVQLELNHVVTHFRFITTEELVALYRAADIVVYPYRAITTSGALATGLAMGKTIIASDIPVFRELLVDRESALLINPEHVNEFAGALIELIADPALRNNLAMRVRSMNFGDDSWNSIAELTEHAYSCFFHSRSIVFEHSSPNG
jgi:glycosyltransferase involved in cell wall biosynthesis